MTDTPLISPDVDEPEPLKLDMGEAISFVVSEQNWIAKLLLVLALTALAQSLVAGALVVAGLPLLPDDVRIELANELELSAFDGAYAYTPAYYGLIPLVLVGLACGAIVLGYYIETVRRVRRNYGAKKTKNEALLPPWNALGVYLADGFRMMGAYAVYLLSAFLIFAVLLFGIGFLVAANQQIFSLVVVLCCMVPVMLAYALFVIFMTSICVVPYSESGRLMSFFELGWAWERSRAYGNLTLNWFVLGIAANLGFSAVQSLPVVGVLGVVLSFAMSAPIQGHLLGQYAAILDERDAAHAQNGPVYGASG